MAVLITAAENKSGPRERAQTPLTGV